SFSTIKPYSNLRWPQSRPFGILPNPPRRATAKGLWPLSSCQLFPPERVRHQQAISPERTTFAVFA
ncbi:MAG TPA: hypothetical protein VNO70_22840, partial [Blastocatellia bacterium]|nr:hypothetical protein [Blastocatellia bacterium]